jgi:hypothetical protein
MATRSTIGIIRKDGTVDTVYCHWDGYYSNNGAILLENYKTTKEVKALIKGGAMSILGCDPGSTEYYVRDRGENPENCAPVTYPSPERVDGESYVYLFDEVTEEWHAKSYGEDFGLLEDKMAGEGVE